VCFFLLTLFCAQTATEGCQAWSLPLEHSSNALLAGECSAACACSSSGDSSLDGEDSALDAPDWADAPAELSGQAGLCKRRRVLPHSVWKHLLTGDHDALAPLLMLYSRAP